MKVLMRVKTYNSDKILLKPLTFEEYQEKVVRFCKDVETQLKTLKNLALSLLIMKQNIKNGCLNVWKNMPISSLCPFQQIVFRLKVFG